MRSLLLLILAGICTAVDIQPQNVPELLGVVPVKYTAEQVIAHIRVMNPGAEVLIYMIDDAAMMNWFMQLPPEDAGYILGLFREQNGKMDITILGHWSREIGVALHEYTHLLEQQIPERREEIRKTFQKLFAPEFDIGTNDLEGPADKDTPWPVSIDLTAVPVVPEPGK